VPVCTAIRAQAMYSTPFVLAALVLSSALVAVAVKPRKPSWKDHPVIVADPNFKPPILVWYTTRNDPSDNGEQLYAWGRFTPRGSRFHLLGSAHKDNADKYKNWDMLELAPQGALRDDWLTFEIARDATMCIVYGISGGALGNVDAMISTPGFSPVGVVKTPSSADLPSDRKYSDYHGKPVAWGFLACRQVKAGIQHMPHKDKLNVGGVWGYNLIFGEPNGKPPPLPKNPPEFGGTPIAGQAFCPPALHAMWQVRSNMDPLAKNVRFAGWHPQVDPIYKCHYGHEHGSPGILAGFVEEMNYTAYKYHDQDEFHPGFKGYVIPVNDKFLYLNAHTETTLRSRIDEPDHTVVIAITDRDTGDVQMQLNCKANFGPSFAEYNSGSMPAFPAPAMMPVGGPDNKRMIDKMYSPKNYFARKINGKRINIYNPDSPDPRLRYENEDPLLGLYEKWTGGGSGQMCFRVAQPYVADGISFDIKDAGTSNRPSFLFLNTGLRFQISTPY
jgi:hypothetical protein